LIFWMLYLDLMLQGIFWSLIFIAFLNMSGLSLSIKCFPKENLNRLSDGSSSRMAIQIRFLLWLTTTSRNRQL